MRNDLVSIIMPSYNCGEFVEETIRSVLAQTYTNWEIIFMDDCSTDDTVSQVLGLCEKDQRIKLFQNHCNSGAAVSRNNALREAKGRWVAFLDSDDLWEPEKLEKQVKFMVENRYAFSYTGYQEIDSEGTLTGVEVSGPKHVTKAGMYAFCWPGCLTVMYDREKVGLIQIADIKKNNDYAMWLKVCQKADCYLLDECLAKYRRGRQGSVSSHGITTMIGWHYKLWHEAEKKNAIAAVYYTCLNLVCGFYKKLKYVKKVKRTRMITNNQKALLALVRAGLWEKEASISQFGQIDFSSISSLAEVQGVIGLLAVGLEHADVKPSQIEVLNIVGRALQIEQRNKDMNAFIAEIVAKMREEGIHTLLVKGQGIAQCYEKPLWRPSGDVDFLLDNENYRKAIDYLRPLATGSKREENYSSHLGLNIAPWYVEVHGSLRTGLAARVDRVVDEVHEVTFKNNKVRVWKNGEEDVNLPAPDEDVFFVFAHFIKHFYKEGMCLRQLCDWCRLLWTYKDSLNHGLLESRIGRAGLMSEWKAFAAVAVNYLGMPTEAMPFYNHINNKADRLVAFILNGSHGKVRDTFEISKIFPLQTLKFLPSIFLNVNWFKIKERLFT